jgi:hypothetical protein
MAFNLGNLPGIDPSILMSQQHAMSDAINQGLMGYQNGLKMKQERTAQQREEEDHQRKLGFRDALQEIYPTVDYHTPEGQTAIIQHLAQKGYAPEAMELSKEFPKPAPNSFTFQDTPAGWMAGNQQTGTMTALGDVPSEKKSTKQAEDKFDAMKGTLDKFMTPPANGWDPLKGDKAVALDKALAYMPPDVLKTNVAQDWIRNHNAAQQNTVFNPATADLAGSRKLGIYVSKFDHAQDLYEKKATPMQNLIGTMNSPTWGTAAGDVSLINQLSLAEFGGYKPSEAEYKAFGKGFTPAEYAQKWLGMAQSGNILPDQVRKNMVKEVEEVSRKTHENFKKTMEEQKKRVQSAGVNPDDVIYPGGVFQDLDDYFTKTAPPAAKPVIAGPAKPHPQDNEAVTWAKQHPKDPRSAAILKVNGF